MKGCHNLIRPLADSINNNATGGYDFAIAGNSFDTSSEPGIVWVMEDINGNGIPDEEWYELKGSNFYEPSSRQYYSVSYFLPEAYSSVPWLDNAGASGVVDWVGTYHSQPLYYPLWVNADHYTLYGSLLPSQTVKDPQSANWINYPFPWGYADNLGSDRLEDGAPAQSCINRFRISDAVYPDGSPVGLSHINFIKVQSAVNANCGWLGEISTEVQGFQILN